MVEKKETRAELQALVVHRGTGGGRVGGCSSGLGFLRHVRAGRNEATPLLAGSFGLDLQEALLVVWNPTLLHPMVNGGVGNAADLSNLLPAAEESNGVLRCH